MEDSAVDSEVVDLVVVQEEHLVVPMEWEDSEVVETAEETGVAETEVDEMEAGETVVVVTEEDWEEDSVVEDLVVVSAVDLVAED